MLDPHTLSNHVYELRLGARLRGLEATIDGVLVKDGTHPAIRLVGTNATPSTSTNLLLRLAPLRTKVQQAFPKKHPVPATTDEKRAYKTLLSQWRGETRPVRITGPLVRKRGQTHLELEVREFELSPARP